MAQWIEIAVPANPLNCEAIADAVVDGVDDARSGVQLRDEHVVFWVEENRLPISTKQLSESLASLASRGITVNIQDVSTTAAPAEEEWRDAWKKHFVATRLTRRLVVVPSWQEYQPDDDDLRIDLDPGLAFGTGLHASTQLVLQAMQVLADRETRVRRFLDVGTGSAILAIAACKLWPECRGTAIDIDPVALNAAAENLRGNDTADRVALHCGTDLPNASDFDLVLANIQADVLEQLRDSLAPRLTPGGTLLMSGVLTSQAKELTRHYLEADRFELGEIRASTLDSEWSLIRLTNTR